MPAIGRASFNIMPKITMIELQHSLQNMLMFSRVRPSAEMRRIGISSSTTLT